MDMINSFKNGLPLFDLLDEYSGKDIVLDDLDLSFGYDDLNKELIEFLQYEVLPDYFCNIDRSHSIEHILNVAENSLLIANILNCNKDIVLTAAIYHDIGRCYSMDFNSNYIISLTTLINDSDLLLDCGVSEDDILLAADAIVDLSPSSEKTNIYSKILSDADKITEILDVNFMIKRYCNYVVSHYTYEPLDRLIDKIYYIIHKRYKDKNSIGHKYYTSVGKQTYDKCIENTLKITNNKKLFLNRLAKLVEKENKKARG